MANQVGYRRPSPRIVAYNAPEIDAYVSRLIVCTVAAVSVISEFGDNAGLSIT